MARRLGGEVRWGVAKAGAQYPTYYRTRDGEKKWKQNEFARAVSDAFCLPWFEA